MAPLGPKSISEENLHDVILAEYLTRSNLTSPCSYTDRTKAIYKVYIALTFYCIILCQSVVTIATIYRTPALHTHQYIFLVSLAMVDILLSLTVGGNACFHLSEMRPRQININVADTILFGVTYSSVTLGAAHMGIISIERYLRISYPFHYISIMTKQRISKVIICAWMLAMINAVIPVIFFRHDKYHIKCINTHPPLAYFSVQSVFVLITVVVIVTFYSKIVHLAIKHKHSANVRRLQARFENKDNTLRNYWTTLLKSVKFCGMMCGVYFACAVPPFVAITMGFSQTIPDSLISISLYTFPLHSVLNFFVSCSMDKSFFKALNKMLKDFKMCCCCLKHNV